jgi:hypothetical protein
MATETIGAKDWDDISFEIDRAGLLAPKKWCREKNHRPDQFMMPHVVKLPRCDVDLIAFD